MDENSNSGWDSCWKWTNRIGGIASIWQVLVPSLGGLGIVAWSWIKGFPAPVTVILGIICFTVLVWLMVGLKRLNADKKQSDIKERSILCGQWTVKKRSPFEPNYIAVWHFMSDGTVFVESSTYQSPLKGTWKLTPTRVFVKWESQRPDRQGPPCNGEVCCDTFHRPITAQGVTGDGWDGWDCLTANKQTSQANK